MCILHAGVAIFYEFIIHIVQVEIDMENHNQLSFFMEYAASNPRHFFQCWNLIL